MRRLAWPAPTPAPATRSPSPPISGGGDRFDRALAEFAEAYADQNERDFEALGVAAHTGKIHAETL